jgi:hypothetical protein
VGINLVYHSKPYKISIGYSFSSMLSYEPGLVKISKKNSIIGFFFQKSIEFVIQNFKFFATVRNFSLPKKKKNQKKKG